MIALVHVGIDVSKLHLDISDPETGFARIPNQEEAVTALAADLARRGRAAVFEATGRYDALLRRAFEQTGVPHARVNPERARDFARAAGLHAKTDRIDARMLARLGAALGPQAREAPDPDRERLARRRKRREQLVAMRAQERARLAECDDPEEEASLRAHLAWLDEAIARADAVLRALIKANEELRRCERRIRTVPGVGPVTAATLLALMPELGRRSAKTVAALAGLAPYARESGRFKGARSVQGGRKTVRDALYMAALTAARSKTALGDYARSLKARGKPPKLVLIALARKLITLVNAIVRDQTTFKAA